MELNKIYNMDCLEGMKNIPSNFIDLTVTSPPYDNLRTYNGYSFDFEGIARELYRITKQGGVAVWVVGDATVKGSETGTSFRQALYFKEIGFNLHDTMIYQKNGTGACGSNYAYWQAFEYMFVFSKGRPKAINLITLDKSVASGGNRIRPNGGKRTTRKTSDRKQRRNNIWLYSVGASNTSDKTNHPAMFPEQLANDHILSWSNPNDVILDPFMGAGTTAKMALLNNRQFIGFELSQEYCDIANKRIEDAKNGVLFN